MAHPLRPLRLAPAGMMRNHHIEFCRQRIIKRQPVHRADIMMQHQHRRAAPGSGDVEFDAGDLFDRLGPDDAHSWLPLFGCSSEGYSPVAAICPMRAGAFPHRGCVRCIAPGRTRRRLGRSTAERLRHMTPEPPEIEELEHAAEWRLRLVDADAERYRQRGGCRTSATLADDLRRSDHAPLWTELRSIGNWLASRTRFPITRISLRNIGARIGVSEHPARRVRDLSCAAWWPIATGPASNRSHP